MRLMGVLLLMILALPIIVVVSNLAVAFWRLPPAQSAPNPFPPPTLTTSPSVPSADSARSRLDLETLAPDILAHGHCLWLGDNWIACKVER